MRRYDEYKYSGVEIIGVISVYLTVLAMTAYFFYRSVWVFVISLVGIPIFLKYYKRILIKKRKEKLAEEFAEVLYSVNANVKAGYATENAFWEARKDIILFYGENSLMAEELLTIKKGIGINRTLESLLLNLGERSGVEDILIFSRVFETAKRNGGNMNKVLERTADTLRAKIEIEKEIQVLIAEKRFELKIMECIPFFIIAYIGFTSKGYFDPMYHNLKGIAVMSICLLVYVGASILGQKLVEIDV